MRLNSTGKTGTVAAQLGEDKVQVRLDGGLGHLPAPEAALSRVNDGETSAEPTNADARTTRAVTTDRGVQIAFDPQFDDEGNPESYQLYLLNGTGLRILFEVKVKTGTAQHFQKFGPLPQHDKIKLTGVPYSWLNERLSVELDVRAAVEGGTGPRHFHQLRIKPKQFFGSYREVDELSRGAHVYTVFARLDDRSVADRAGQVSLKELTRAQLRKQSGTANVSNPSSAASPISGASPQERAAFSDVLDLHLSALVDDARTVPKERALEVQLAAFDRYMDQALRLDVPQVYVIHGVGDGVLKAAVHKRLATVPFVRKFHNSYHPRYGYGATEVLFEL